MNSFDYLETATEPWVRYRYLLDILGKKLNDPLVLQTREAMISHPLVQVILHDLHDWPGVVLNSHKSANQLYHKLEFLADLGLTDQDGPIGTVLKTMQAHQSLNGIPQLPMQISESHGGTNTPLWAWALCDAPVQLYAAVKMSSLGIQAFEAPIHALMNLGSSNGWGCHVSAELGKFRGPGKKADPCPYATLVMLKLLSLDPKYAKTAVVESGIESLLHLWNQSLVEHPYQFYMGHDFRKLKAPFIWYDILHVTEVLSRYEIALTDPRFMEMFQLILSQADAFGRYQAQSVWQAWKGWDFAQKEIPSPWLTLMVEIIEKRVHSNKNITKTMV